MSENEGTTTEETGSEAQEALSQSEVDKIVAKVRAEERRKATEKFKDYDDLKAKAGEKQTLEERIAEMEQRTAQAVAMAARSDIAAEFGISKEDRDVFLTATDEDGLRAQAKRLHELSAERKKQAPHVPSEGATTTPADTGEREFVRNLFGRD